MALINDVQGAFRVEAGPSSLRRETGTRERDALRARFADRLVVRDELTRKLVSYQGNKKQPGLRWLRYKEGFSAELVRGALAEADGPGFPFTHPPPGVQRGARGGRRAREQRARREDGDRHGSNAQPTHRSGHHRLRERHRPRAPPAAQPSPPPKASSVRTRHFTLPPALRNSPVGTGTAS